MPYVTQRREDPFQMLSYGTERRVQPMTQQETTTTTICWWAKAVVDQSSTNDNNDKSMTVQNVISRTRPVTT